MIIIYLTFLLLIFYYYGKRNHSLVLFFMMAIITGGFGVLDAETGLQKTDLLLIPTVLISINEYSRNKHFFQVKKDALGKCIILILLFLTLEFLFSVLLGIETPIWAFKVVRVQFLLLLYFYFRGLNSDIWQRFFKLVLFFSIVQGILFYLQVVGITGILANSVDSNAEDVRYANYPMLTSFFIVYYLLKKDISIWIRLAMLLFWGIMIVLSQSRGPILGVMGAFAMYCVVLRSKKSIGYMLVGIVLYVFIVNPLIKTRDMSERASTKDDIAMIISSNAEELSGVKTGQVGTIAFRIGMLAERWIYLKDNPEYLLFGVGCIHEQSPANRFHFFLGTHNEKFFYRRCMIESGDIAWVPLLLRYGIVGVFIFSLLLFYWIKICFRQYPLLNNYLSRAASLMSASVTLTSFNTTLYDSVNTIFLLCVYLGMFMSEVSSRNKTIRRSQLDVSKASMS